MFTSSIPTIPATKTRTADDETSTHFPLGLGVIDFDEIMPELAKASRLSHDWWTIDLCFWPDAWNATATCKTALDQLIVKYG